jgi:hypothetical protein
MTFKVGDEVVFGVVKGGSFHGAGVFDFHDFIDTSERGGQTVLVEGRVDKIEKGTDFRVEFTLDGQNLFWYFPEECRSDNPATPEQYALWWPRLKDSRPAKIVLPPPVWTEKVGVGRKMELPDSVLAQMIDRGERGIRRTMRSWPDGQTLTHRQERIKGDIEDTIQIQWFWEKEAD